MAARRGSSTARRAPGFEGKRRESKMLPKIKPRFWIDQQDYSWTKLRAEVTDTLSFGWVVARLHKGSVFEMQQVRVNDEVWLPQRFDVKLDARVALLKGVNENVHVTYKDYRRFRTDTKISVAEPTQYSSVARTWCLSNYRIRIRNVNHFAKLLMENFARIRTLSSTVLQLLSWPQYPQHSSRWKSASNPSLAAEMNTCLLAERTIMATNPRTTISDRAQLTVVSPGRRIKQRCRRAHLKTALAKHGDRACGAGVGTAVPAVANAECAGA